MVLFDGVIQEIIEGDKETHVLYITGAIQICSANSVGLVISPVHHLVHWVDVNSHSMLNNLYVQCYISVVASIKRDASQIFPTSQQQHLLRTCKQHTSLYW